MADHRCLFSFCNEMVAAQYALCFGHAQMLPRAYNDAIRASYTAGDTRETAGPACQRAIANAAAWLQETYAATSREKWDKGKWERLCQVVRARDAARAELRKAMGLPKPPHLRLV